MKKATALVVLASLFTVHAHATKARQQSLQGAAHLVDSQTIFTYTSHVLQLGNQLTLEFGPTADGTTEPKAEGGLFRKSADGAMYGFYLGHHDETIAGFRSNAGFGAQSNPVQGFYGKDNWAMTVGLSNSEDKNTEIKETTLSAGFGQTFSDFTWGVNAQLLSKAEQPSGTNTDKFNGAPLLSANILQSGQTYWHGGVTYGAMKSEVGGASTDVKPLGISAGYVDRTLGNDQTDLYYGITLNYSDVDFGGKHLKVMSLPVAIGLEHPMNTWSTFRASIQQNVLLGSVKDGTAAAPNDKEAPIANNTNVAAGLGLKYGGIVLDGVLSAATSGNINGNAVLARAGMTYSF
ncbi:MAG: hypothetical protein KF789_05235 [Bdellovibrionaceae bacterium]|nr:hypothetical protein [Pseudobdellovibrionaceae bacterium]